MTTVLTSGSFDMLHLGHVDYLERAAAFGDVLGVGVDSDEKIRSRKGPHRPYVPEAERIQMLQHLRTVDYVYLKHADWPRWHLISLIDPDVLVCTEDTYTPEEIQEIESTFGCKVEVLERTHPVSTTERAVAIAAALTAQEGERGGTVDALTEAESTALAGEVWQETDGVLLLCVVPGETWGDLRGERVPWDAPLIARPLRRLLDTQGQLVAAPSSIDDAVRAAKAKAWNEGRASAHGYDLSDPLDREEYDEEFGGDGINPYREASR